MYASLSSTALLPFLSQNEKGKSLVEKEAVGNTQSRTSKPTEKAESAKENNRTSEKYKVSGHHLK